MANRKLTLKFDEKVVQRIDVYADSIGVSRTAAIMFLITQGLMTVSTPEMMSQLSELMKIVDENKE